MYVCMYVCMYADPSSLSAVALAYIRARNADPMCSFGDFAAVSHKVDLATALVLKNEVRSAATTPTYIHTYIRTYVAGF